MYAPGRLSFENRWQLLAQQIFTTALDLVFPPVCVGCERVGSFLCERCIASLKPARERYVPELDGVQVRASFEGAVRQALHGLKYERQRRLAEPLGKLLDQALQPVDWPVDLICPVPLHEKRLRERGYNQAGLLAEALANRRQWPYSPTAIRRNRATASQVDLNAQERQRNVAGAFVAEQEIIQGKVVLVVDDVLTTGATLAACAEALRAAGASHVYGVAVAGAG